MDNPQRNNLTANTVIYLNEIAYYVQNQVECTLDLQHDEVASIVPAVVFNVGSRDPPASYLASIFKRFEESDDVFQPGFTQSSVIIAQMPAWHDDIDALPLRDSTLFKFLAARSCVIHFMATETSVPIPEGPYFIRDGGTLHRAWRLYADENRAFTIPVIPDDGGDKHKFSSLHAGAYSGLYPVIAVPSSLYTPPSPEKPLNGLRVSVKDIFHLAGVQTTAGSRSYTKFYGSQDETAALVQKMIDFGAVIVGKTKTNAYAGSEAPPEKCIDYFPPWNPRGDGYQGPSGSSSGAGSSVASYGWLDLALGTDSTGSIRNPAASYGLWGLRASRNSFELTGAHPNVEAFDALGIVARSHKELRQIISNVSVPATIRTGYSSSAVEELGQVRPAKVLYPTDWFPMDNAAQQQMVEMFLGILEDELQLMAQRVSLEAEWSKTAPEDLRGMTLNKYLEKSIYWPNYYDGYHSWDGFRDEFRAEFGHAPYTSPFTTKRWGLCKDITEVQRDQGFQELEVYRSWVNDHILKPDSEYNIMLVPLGRPGANYRDVVPAPGGEFKASAYDLGDLSTVTGLPQLVIPKPV